MFGFSPPLSTSIAAGIAAAALLGLAVQTVRIDGVHVGVLHVPGLVSELADAKRQLADTRVSLTQEKALRAAEHDQNASSFANQSARCTSRVAIAKDAARVINEVTSHVYPETPGAPRAPRPLIGADSLRRIAGQAGTDQAARLPAGGDDPARH